MKIHAQKTGRPVQSISPEASRMLLRYSFPGNVRELENIIAAGLLAEHGNILTPDAIGHLVEANQPVVSGQDGLMSMAELEKIHIFRTLEFTENNRTEAAAILGISLRTLQRKLKEYEKNAG